MFTPEEETHVRDFLRLRGKVQHAEQHSLPIPPQTLQERNQLDQWLASHFPSWFKPNYQLVQPRSS